MEVINTKDFPYSLDIAWEALHKTSYLDIETGSRTEIISDSEWNSYVQIEGKDAGKTHYTTTFDDARKIATVEGVSDVKKVHDFIYLELTEINPGHVSLKVDIVINLGLHVVARLIAPFLKTHVHHVIIKAIFNNFDALCKNEEPHAMTQDELKEIAAGAVADAFSISKQEALHGLEKHS